MSDHVKSVFLLKGLLKVGNPWGWFSLPHPETLPLVPPDHLTDTASLSFSSSSAWAAMWGALGSLTESVDKDTVARKDGSPAYLLLHNKPSGNLVVKSNYCIMLTDSVVRNSETGQWEPLVSVPG